MQIAAEESDTWQDLPEFDAGLEDPASDEPVEVSVEIDELDEADALDRDDSSAQDLDVGMELDFALESAQDPATHDLVLDIGQLLDTDDEQAGESADDSSGPLEFDVSVDVPELDEPATLLDEDRDADVEETLDEELPGLDADEEGDFGEDVSSLWSASEWAADETLPAWSAQRWISRELGMEHGALNALACANGTLVAGGRELVRYAEGGAVRQAVSGGSVLALSLAGVDFDTIVYATALGRLLRRRTGAPGEACEGWRAAAGLNASDAVQLELGQPSGRAPNTLLLRTSTGKLLYTEDLGASFAELAFDGAALALSRQSDPAWVLIERDAGRALARFEPSARSLEFFPLDAAASFVAGGQQPILCANGSLVAILDEARGLALSYDTARSFARVAGTSNASAAAAGDIDGSPTLWLSTLEESTNRSWIVRVTGGVAERVAELHAAPAEGLEESSDNVRVSALCWDPQRAMLWGGGGFGLVSWCLPTDGKE
ncbi:MAG TPA: hypothetical protein VK524_34880 [Polyangiaceae bacterium]|nr:hypothetical protein [Polyangiaceae bacterium]